MSAEAFISTAIARGEDEGLSALTGKERVVFLISEVEVLTDMQGIDSVVDRVEKKEMSGVSDAFEAIGAQEIARHLRKIEADLPLRDEGSLDEANRLITARAGYSYDSIKMYVEKRA
jgi:hypothetical protein